jgi:hypothetical protein
MEGVYLNASQRDHRWAHGKCARGVHKDHLQGASIEAPISQAEVGVTRQLPAEPRVGVAYIPPRRTRG